MFQRFLIVWSVGALILVSDRGQVVLGQDTFDIESAIEAVERFESSIWGLQFDLRPMASSTNAYDKLPQIEHVEISEDGEFRKCVTRLRRDHVEFPASDTTGAYASAPGRFCFIAERSRYDSPKIDPTFGCVAIFFKDGQLPFESPSFGGLPCGFTGDGLTRISDMLRKGKVEMVEQQYEGRMYKALNCNVDGYPDLMLLFDESNRLRRVISRCEPGDKVGGHKFEDPQVMPPGESTTLYLSLKKYVPVGDREVLAEYDMGVETSTGIRSTVTYERQNFQPLTAPLTSRISLPELEIEDGTHVSCDGQMGIDYIYDGGKLYMAADAGSVEAARKARLRSSRYGGVWYYSLSLLAFLVVLTVLVYIRNREA